MTDSPRIDFSGPGRLIMIMIDITNIDGVSDCARLLNQRMMQSQRYIYRVIWILPDTQPGFALSLGIIGYSHGIVGEGPRGFCAI
jgi:hypothetical protein